MSYARNGRRNGERLFTPPRVVAGHQLVLITGGAGFIGANLARRLLEQGVSVLILDNLSRPGVRRNLEWLRAFDARRTAVEVRDIRDAAAVNAAVAVAGRVYHFAAQVAVTTSLLDPRADFDINVGGTINVLEAVRRRPEPPPLLVTSTNKVYGSLRDVRLRLRAGRYEPEDAHTRARGVDESTPLDFHSPYGCSKGAADQYVLDYARTFGIDAVVFRMSCIYGPRQFGNEDQGWVAHFMLRALAGQRITLYGDGHQVRDLLFIDDLVDALLLAHDRIRELRGRAFNIGGGPANAVSIAEVIDRIARRAPGRVQIVHDGWRHGDQRYYVSDTRSFQEATGWQPRVPLDHGLDRLWAWLSEHVTRSPAPPVAEVRR